MTQPLEQNLADTLAKVEKALLSPPISGELTAWIQAVQDAASTLAVDLTSHLRTVLHVQYDEIAKTDPEMSAHVEKLERGDDQLLSQLTQFLEDLHDLAEAASHVTRNEGKLAEQRQKVEEAGIALVLAIKKQQAAAAAWLGEAHFRDRGVAAD
jgi:vacuolar-type H+-ATPase subunit I/STV1